MIPKYFWVWVRIRPGSESFRRSPVSTARDGIGSCKANARVLRPGLPVQYAVKPSLFPFSFFHLFFFSKFWVSEVTSISTSIFSMALRLRGHSPNPAADPFLSRGQSLWLTQGCSHSR